MLTDCTWGGTFARLICCQFLRFEVFCWGHTDILTDYLVRTAADSGLVPRQIEVSSISDSATNRFFFVKMRSRGLVHLDA